MFASVTVARTQTVTAYQSGGAVQAPKPEEALVVEHSHAIVGAVVSRTIVLVAVDEVSAATSVAWT